MTMLVIPETNLDASWLVQFTTNGETYTIKKVDN